MRAQPRHASSGFREEPSYSAHSFYRSCKRGLGVESVATFAYPALLAAFYGAYRVGKRRETIMGAGFEWVRVCVLAIMLGLLVGVQSRLILSGIVQTTLGLSAGILSIAAAVALLGLHIIEFYERRGETGTLQPLAA